MQIQTGTAVARTLQISRIQSEFGGSSNFRLKGFAKVSDGQRPAGEAAGALHPDSPGRLQGWARGQRRCHAVGRIPFSDPARWSPHRLQRSPPVGDRYADLVRGVLLDEVDAPDRDLCLVRPGPAELALR